MANQTYSDLDPERAQRLADMLQAQSGESLDRTAALDEKIAQTTFLTNGGGAAAVLAYLGGGAAKGGGWALVCFCIGLIATGFAQRFMRTAWLGIHNDRRQKAIGFINNDLTVAECSTSEKPVPDWGERAERAGWVGQIAFVVGVILGAAEILW